MCNWKTFQFQRFLFSSLVWFLFRALADILRQQGPVPISQYEHENIAAIDGSPKDETPVRTSKNHYTPVHGKTSNHGRKRSFFFFFFYRLTSLTADMFCCPCLLCYCTENGYVQLYIYLGSILDSYNSENIVWLGLGTKITWFRFWKDSWHPREGPVCDPPLMIWFCQKSTHGRS